MTREEAIRKLKRELEAIEGDWLFNEFAQALDMAIEALSADNPTVDKEYLIDLIQGAVYDGEACEKLIDLVDRPAGEWTTEQVAEMLANLFGDECACNFNDIDEWLPLACKYANTQCPDPKEKHGCWMQFLIQVGWNK